MANSIKIWLLKWQIEIFKFKLRHLREYNRMISLDAMNMKSEGH